MRRFAVAGLFRSGMFEYDSSLIFVALGNGAALLADDPQAERGLELRVSNLFDAPAIARQIAERGGPTLSVSDWTQNDAPLFAALKLEKFTYFVVLLLIVLVAAFNIIATLVMVVMERRKEIAILRAMGARGRLDRARSFCARARHWASAARSWASAAACCHLSHRQVPFHPSARRSFHDQRASGTALPGEFHRRGARRYRSAVWQARSIRRSRRARCGRSR